MHQSINQSTVIVGYFARWAVLLIAALIVVISVIAAMDFPSADVLIYGQPDAIEDAFKLFAIDTERGLSEQFLPMLVFGTDIASSPDGRQLAFIEAHDAPNQISLWDIDTRQITRYAFPEATEVAFSWSPNNHEIAYTTFPETSLGVLDLTTGAKQTLISSDEFSFGLPMWSPDGTRIAYFRLFEATADLCLFNTNTLNESCTNAVDATWSPDGRYIAFTQGIMQNSQLYHMNVDTSQITLIPLNSSHNLSIFNPNWSPNEAQIAITIYYVSHIDTQLYVINMRGQLLHDIDIIGEVEQAGIWSPDGERLAYVALTSSMDARLRLYHLASETISPLLAEIEIRPPGAPPFHPVWWPPIQ